MKNYEVIYIINSNKTDEEAEEIINKFRQIVVTTNGKVVSVEKWGRKKLSFIIKKESKGNYVFMKINCEAKTLNELVRNFRLNDNIIRHLVTKVE
ncbi:MAG: 30S ribosomal protein S6 [bacterium]